MVTGNAIRILGLGAIIGAAACGGGNIPGQLGAQRVGDLSNPPAERIDGPALLAQSCAAVAPSSGLDATPSSPMSFLRQPYLQQTKDRSVDVLWVSPAGIIPTITVTTPEGAVVSEAPAIADTSAKVAAGSAQWQASMAGLAPDTVYCYQVRGGDGTSVRTAFRTAPAVGDDTTVRFVALGDSGAGGDDQRALLAQLSTVPFDFMVHTGDIAYGSGTRAEFEQNFFDVYAALLGNFPIFPISGNHEYMTEDAAPFREAFDLPGNGGPGGVERWYSYNWGEVHFVALDTERTGPAQAAWLEADLAANRQPWTIVFGHKPPFSSGEHGSDGAFRQYFVPVLERHHVDLVLNGHDHDYERTTPQNGVTYVVTGGGGAGVRVMGTSAFTAFSEAVIHFVYVTVSGNQLSLHAIDGLGKEFDSLVLRH